MSLQEKLTAMMARPGQDPVAKEDVPWWMRFAGRSLGTFGGAGKRSPEGPHILNTLSWYLDTTVQITFSSGDVPRRVEVRQSLADQHPVRHMADPRWLPVPVRRGAVLLHVHRPRPEVRRHGRGEAVLEPGCGIRRTRRRADHLQLQHDDPRRQRPDLHHGDTVRHDGARTEGLQGGHGGRRLAADGDLAQRRHGPLRPSRDAHGGPGRLASHLNPPSNRRLTRRRRRRCVGRRRLQRGSRLRPRRRLRAACVPTSSPTPSRSASRERPSSSTAKCDVGGTVTTLYIYIYPLLFI